MSKRSTVCEINVDISVLEERDDALLAFIASGRNGRSYEEIRQHFGWNMYRLMTSTTYLRKTGQVVSIGSVRKGPRYGTPDQAERAQWVYEKRRNFVRWLERRRNGTTNIHD
jgi:hypothetical protein